MYRLYRKMTIYGYFSPCLANMGFCFGHQKWWKHAYVGSGENMHMQAVLMSTTADNFFGVNGEMRNLSVHFYFVCFVLCPCIGWCRGHIVFWFSIRGYVRMCIWMYVLLYVCTYVHDPVRLGLRHLYQVEFCSFIVRYPTAGASVYCEHILVFAEKIATTEFTFCHNYIFIPLFTPSIRRDRPGKQSRLRLHAAECGIWSGFTQFASHS